VPFESEPGVLWRVEVEIPQWRTWSPARLTRLRRALSSDANVKDVLEVWPLRWRPLRRYFPPYLTVEVAADSPARAAATAEAAVRHALVKCGTEPEAKARIISTDGLVPKSR
jgi:hypothetical protein